MWSHLCIWLDGGIRLGRCKRVVGSQGGSQWGKTTIHTVMWVDIGKLDSRESGIHVQIFLAKSFQNRLLSTDWPTASCPIINLLILLFFFSIFSRDRAGTGTLPLGQSRPHRNYNYTVSRRLQTKKVLYKIIVLRKLFSVVTKNTPKA